ncbi:MAG: Ig-like domain-containing protein [Bacteroidia bacterium]
MKTNFFRILFAVLVTTVAFTSCKKDKIDPDKDKVLVITNGAKSIPMDGSQTYSAQFVLADGTIQPATGVTWSSSTSSVATISSGGVIAIAGAGSTTITATVTTDEATFTASVPLGIVTPTVFAVVPSAIIWEPSGSLQLETFYLGTATPTYTFSSSNNSVASVSSTGVVSFNGVGNCQITVTASTHPNNPFIVPVLVVGVPTVTLPVTRIEVTPSSSTLFRQETAQLSAQAFTSTAQRRRPSAGPAPTRTSPPSALAVWSPPRPRHRLHHRQLTRHQRPSRNLRQPGHHHPGHALPRQHPRHGNMQFTASAPTIPRTGGTYLPGVTGFTVYPELRHPHV